jgi:hypothetical protein
MIRKGQIQEGEKEDIIGQVKFIGNMSGSAA